MPWYYAGPDAKPTGPFTLDELRARRESGAVTGDTYIIEHTGQAGEALAWRRYQDVFPASAVPAMLPPPPPVGAAPYAATPPLAPPLASPAPPTATAHPLFPSASVPPPAVPLSPLTDPYAGLKPTNGWCGWGFGLALAGFFLSWACGVGLFLALPAFIICIVGLFQLSAHREQSGQGLAIAGIALSGLGLLISIAWIAYFAMPLIKAHELTVTEQTSNDSE